MSSFPSEKPIKIPTKPFQKFKNRGNAKVGDDKMYMLSKHNALLRGSYSLSQTIEPVYKHC